MRELRYTLLTDGPSDRALLPILTWLLRNHDVSIPIQPSWLDPRLLVHPPKTLTERIQFGLDLFPCDLLFVHRDAERETLQSRRQEIESALMEFNKLNILPPVICVIPIRMQEAWLLFHEEAIRYAAGNPNGRIPLELPVLRAVEQLPDPKEVLYDLLRKASGLSGRRLRNFPVIQSAIRLTDFIDDYSPLRILSAFQSLEEEITKIITEHKWIVP